MRERSSADSVSLIQIECTFFQTLHKIHFTPSGMLEPTSGYQLPPHSEPYGVQVTRGWQHGRPWCSPGFPGADLRNKCNITARSSSRLAASFLGAWVAPVVCLLVKLEEIG